MNKIIKGCLICAGGYKLSNLMFDLGKAHMLGTLLKYDVSAKETYDALSECKSPRLKFIADFANRMKNDD